MASITEIIDALRAAELEARVKATEPFTGVEQLTIGPDQNNLSGTYTAKNAAWDIVMCDKISSDVLLMLQSRAGLMFRVLRETNQTPPIPRRAKDLLLKDQFPVFTVKDMRG